MPTNSPLEKLSKDAYVIHPVDESTTNDPNDPQLIVLCGWMGASVKHITKYSDTYRLLFPAATVLVIRSRPSAFYGFKSSQLTAMRPASTFIQSRFPAVVGQPSSILVHSFSNGGAVSLIRLDEAMRGPLRTVESQVKQPLLQVKKEGVQPRAFIFDSCPGTASLKIYILAFGAGVRSKLLKIPATILITLFYGFTSLRRFITRKPELAEEIQDYLTFRLPPVPRLYLFSKTDVLIPHKCVTDHAKVAESRGIDTRVVEFDQTRHVAHTIGLDPTGVKNSDKYWKEVKDLWRRS